MKGKNKKIVTLTGELMTQLKQKCPEHGESRSDIDEIIYDLEGIEGNPIRI